MRELFRFQRFLKGKNSGRPEPSMMLTIACRLLCSASFFLVWPISPASPIVTTPGIATALCSCVASSRQTLTLSLLLICDPETELARWAGAA